VESPCPARDQALSLQSGSADSKTLHYQRTPNPREYQIVRTPTKATTCVQDQSSQILKRSTLEARIYRSRTRLESELPQNKSRDKCSVGRHPREMR